MQLSLESREKLIKEYTDENFTLKDQLKTQEKLIQRIKNENHKYIQKLKEFHLNDNELLDIQENFVEPSIPFEKGNTRKSINLNQPRDSTVTNDKRKTLTGEDDKSNGFQSEKVKIVTQNQGMKNVDTIFSNNYGAKSL